MRTLLVLFVTVLLATVSFAAEQPATPLPNPGFEKGTEQWSVADDISQVMAEAAHSGRIGLRVGTTGYTATGSSVTSARFPVTPGQQIKMSFQARTAFKCGAAYLLFFKADGKWGKNFICAVDKPDGEWHAYEMTATAPDDAAKVAIWVHSYSSAKGTIDFDDFALGGLAADAVAEAPPAPRKTQPVIVPATLPARAKPPVIILKFDDVKQMGNGTVHRSWQRVADYLATRNIKCSMGVICQTLQEATPKYTKWIRDGQESGRIEFWFHGWDHAVHEEGGEKFNEFNKRSYEDQRKRFDDSQRLAQEKLGFAFKTFGPPGGVGNGSMDENTFRVMADEPHMSCWLYPGPINDAGKKLEAAGKVTILDRVWQVNLEGGVGIPDSRRFQEGYAKYPDREYFVLQGHPAMWTDERFAEFVKIIDILVEQKAVFMTPSEYVSSRKEGK